MVAQLAAIGRWQGQVQGQRNRQSTRHPVKSSGWLVVTCDMNPGIPHPDRVRSTEPSLRDRRSRTRRRRGRRTSGPRHLRPERPRRRGSPRPAAPGPTGRSTGAGSGSGASIRTNSAVASEGSKVMVWIDANTGRRHLVARLVVPCDIQMAPTPRVMTTAAAAAAIHP